MNPAALEGVLQCLRELLPSSPCVRDASDVELLGRFAAQHDEGAFLELLRRHGSLVYGVCMRILGDAHAAEDAFQATFLLLSQRASLLRRPGSLVGWLHAVAQRVAYQARRADERRRSRERQHILHAAVSVDDLAWREVRELLDAELARLPEKYRAPLILCYLEGVSHAEAARRLDCSDTVLRGRLERGREALRRRLARLGLPLAAPLLLLAAPARVSAVLRTTALATVRAAAAGSPVTPAVASLIAGSAGLFGVTNWKVVAGLVVIAVAVSLGSTVVLRPSQAQPAPTVSPTSAPAITDGLKARVDLLGDPLPPGALVRMGTIRFRHGNGATLAFASDGKSLLTCGGDRNIRTWDPISERLISEQRLPDGLYTPVLVLSPDGRLLAFQDAGAMDTFYLWDVGRNQLRHKLSLGESSYHRALFSPDSQTIVTAQRSGILRAWDVATGQSRLLGKHKREILSWSFSADGTLMTLSWDPTLGFWDVKNGRERSRIAIPENMTGAVLSPDGRTVAAWTWHNEDLDKGLRFLDATTGKPAKGWIAPKLKRVHTARFTPDGKTVLISTERGVLVWDPLAGKSIRTLPAGVAHCLTFSPDGKTAAALSSGEMGTGPRGR